MATQNFKIKHGLNLGEHELIDALGNINLPNGAAINVGGAPLDALPDQTGQSGKYLSTNGSVASWNAITQYTPPTNQGVGNFLAGDGTYKPVNLPTLVSQLINDADYQTSSQVTASLAALVDAAPSTLNTLNELATALGDDPNFATTITSQIGAKWTQDNAKITNWDTAYSWGNHGAAGYATLDNVNQGLASRAQLSGATFTGLITVPSLSMNGVAVDAISASTTSYFGQNSSSQYDFYRIVVYSAGETGYANRIEIMSVQNAGTALTTLPVGAVLYLPTIWDDIASAFVNGTATITGSVQLGSSAAGPTYIYPVSVTYTGSALANNGAGALSGNFYDTLTVTYGTNMVTVGGGVTATSFSGNGAGLTNLNWSNISNVPSSIVRRTAYTAQAGDTTFDATYTAGSVEVYINGMHLMSGTDYTATNGTSITLTDAAQAGDEIEIIGFSTFNIANVYTQAETSALIASSITSKWTQDNTKISNWDTAHSWGNHASAGYLTPTYASVVNITNTTSAIQTSVGGALKVAGGSYLGYGSDKAYATFFGRGLASGMPYVAANWNGSNNTATDGYLTAWYFKAQAALYTPGATLNNTNNTFSTPVVVTDTTASSSKTTGALKVTGGVGISGDVYATSFHGDGSGLTNIPSDDTKANLSGATFTGTVNTTTLQTPTIQNTTPGNGLTINENTSIGGSSPVPAKLKVIRTAAEGSTNGHVIANLHRTGVSTISHGSGLLMTTDYANSTGIYIGGNGKGEFGVYTTQDNSVSNVQKFGISQTGAVTLPLQPMFQYAASINQEPTTETKITYDTLIKKVGNDYDSATSRFTAPVAGWYQFTWRYWFKQNTAGTIFNYVKKNNSIYREFRTTLNNSSYAEYQTEVRTWGMWLEASEYVELYAYSPGGCFHSSSGERYSEFSGRLLG